MKSYLISDNRDTWVGMRLAGIQGVIVHEREEILEVFHKAVEDTTIGIVIVTELIGDTIRDEIMAQKLKHNKQLIIEIPDRHGTKRGPDLITSYIRESIGIQV
ncbi:MAG TPA: ATP synthase subunit F [Epulopiscium sp.]|nr:ATP synthase subunit F [Candidatus Epulonipiscium sp.]